jgi:hypothetical protein
MTGAEACAGRGGAKNLPEAKDAIMIANEIPIGFFVPIKVRTFDRARLHNEASEGGSLSLSLYLFGVID